jgi:glycosyltransferase involved in cell wall biosynthesis
MEKHTSNALDLSIVIPYYGCEGTLVELCQAIEKVLSDIQIDSEVIFILDGSTGGSWKNLSEVTMSFGFLSFQLTRNFGQHAATKAGLSLSKGSMVIIMDCDLQDPPSLIPNLINSATDGVDVVFAKRKGSYDGIRRRILRKASNFFLKIIYPKGFDLDTGSYMLLKREVVDQILSIKDNSHVGLLVNWLNYPSSSVSYMRDRRTWGKSNYSFRKLFGHGIEALSFNLVYFFKKLIGVSVFISVLFSSFGAVALLRALTAQTSSGWASIFILLTIGFSITLTLLSLVGFTIADKLSNRNLPLYLIRKDNQG